MKRMNRVISALLAAVIVIGAFGVTSFAAQKSYSGKYGTVLTVKSDYKTKCSAYTSNTDYSNIYIYFDSNGYKQNVFYNFEVYSDSAYTQSVTKASGAFPSVDSHTKIKLNFSTKKSGVYYGKVYTSVKNASTGKTVIDSDTVKTFTVKVNKIGKIVPTITAASVAATGNCIKWEAVRYADKYNVYRKVSGGSWKLLKAVSKTSYVDTSAKAGTTYLYTVKALDGTYASKYNTTGVSICYLTIPEFTSAEYAGGSTVELMWNEVKGADGYYLYRKAENEASFKRIATVKGGAISYSDASADGKSIYSYKVKAFKGTLVSALSEEVTVEPRPTVKIENIRFDGTSSYIVWSKLDGAENYTVYKKVDDGEWAVLASFGSEVNAYEDNDVVPTSEYSYAVTAFVNGEETALDKKGFSVKCLEAPAVTSCASSVCNSVLVKWNAADGAEYYNVFRKCDGEDFALIGKTSLASYYDKTAKKNNLKYYYAVQAVSSFNESELGKTRSVLFMAAPAIESISAKKTGNTVTWSKVSGATGYRIYRRTPLGNNTMIAEVNNTLRYSDVDAVYGKAYYYTVCALNGSVRGAYEKGKGVNIVDVPVLAGASQQKNSRVVVKWEAVEDAEKYCVYKKAAGGSWSRIATVTSLSCTDSSAMESGTEYIYTVRASKDGALGEYDGTGVAVIYLSSPDVKIAPAETGYDISWPSVNGAQSYKVYRRPSGGSYKCIGETTDLFFSDVEADMAKDYDYTVRANNGVALSGYKDFAAK